MALSACNNGSLMQAESNPVEHVAKMEQTLAGVGFKPLYAKTPKTYAAIKSLPQHSLVFHEYQNQYRYVYADTELCGCVYIGDRNAYQRYQEMLKQENISDLQSDAAVLNQPLSSDWTGWGPWYDPAY